jgi:hypothetical protein
MLGSVYVIIQEKMYYLFNIDLFLQGNNGVSGNSGWTSVLLPDVQIPTGIWWTSFTYHTICNVSFKCIIDCH